MAVKPNDQGIDDFFFKLFWKKLYFIENKFQL